MIWQCLNEHMHIFMYYVVIIYAIEKQISVNQRQFFFNILYYVELQWTSGLFLFYNAEYHSISSSWKGTLFWIWLSINNTPKWIHCVCVCVCVRACVRLCVHAFVRVYMCVCVWGRERECAHVCMHARACECVCVRKRERESMYVHVCVCAHARVLIQHWKRSWVFASTALVAGQPCNSDWLQWLSEQFYSGLSHQFE